MLSDAFALFTWFSQIILVSEWFIVLAVAVCFVALVRLFWYLLGVSQ